MADEIAEKYARFVAEQIEAGRCCGSCEFFAHEDATGIGWCQFHDGQRSCGETCRHWAAQASQDAAKP
jgi:hypothetical protein